MKTLAELKATMKESARNGNGYIAMLCAIKISQIEHSLGTQSELFDKQDKIGKKKEADIDSISNSIH